MGLLSFMRELAGGGGGTAEDRLMKQELEQVRAMAEAAERGDGGALSTPLGPKVRRQYHFVGSVQGVGFRWTMTNLASAVGATGWVRNEDDGSVTAEIQGIAEQVDAVLDGMERNYNGRRWMGGFTIDRRFERPLADDEYDFKPIY